MPESDAAHADLELQEGVEEALDLEVEVFEQPGTTDMRRDDSEPGPDREDQMAESPGRRGWTVQKQGQSELEGSPAVTTERHAVR